MPSDFSYTIMLALRSGGDFTFQDVELISYHIKTHYRGIYGLKIYCLWDKIDQEFELKNCTCIPTPNKEWPGWWTKMNLFNPEMEQYRPFLYLDLDTAVVGDISELLDRNCVDFIGLEDFYNKGKWASGMMWLPMQNEEIRRIWNEWIKGSEELIKKFRGDQNFISNFTLLNRYWQDKTNKICSFKVRNKDRSWLQEIPEDVSVVCFHGQPRIKDAISVPWVREYVRHENSSRPKVTIIIPYKIDRGWMKEAINSVPSWTQLLISQGEGSWAENFNKALPQVTGDYVKFLHEDDLLSKTCIEDSVNAIKTLGVDFIHGKAIDFYEDGTEKVFSSFRELTFDDLLRQNYIHGGSLMYKRELFDQLGGFDETLKHGEEYEFNLRCLQAGFKLGYCDSVLYYYRRHDRQKSNIGTEEWKEINKQIKDKYKKICQTTC
jgi:hypothetical protein